MANKFLDFFQGYGAFPAHRRHRAKEQRRKRQSIRTQRFTFKKNQRQVKRYERDISDFMKKYGGEQYFKKSALNAGQRKTLNDILKQGREYLGAKEKTVEKLPKLEKSELFRGGENKLLDLLGGGEQSYERFAAPHRREFERNIVSQIAERYAGQGASSGLANALSEAGTDLGERLGRLRESLGIEAVGPALQYANAGQLNRQQRIENAMNQNAQQYSRGAQLGQLGLGTQAFNAIYRQPTPPILPAEYQAGQTYQPQPSFLQKFGMAAAPALGTALGGAAGGALGQGLAGAFTPSVAQNSQLAPRVAPQQARFGGFNQMSGQRSVAGVY